MKHNILLFDFLRAVAAVAVVLCHCAILGGGILFNSVGERAVDVFMFTSGFLMVFTATKSREYQQLETQKGVRTFWLRRFFRISPLYYLMLTVAVVAAPYLGTCRDQIAAVLTGAETPVDRYFFSSVTSTLLWHFSYLFGLVPSKAFSTPLPDWSLSLEMQFYAVFPFVFFLLRRHLPSFLGLCAGMIALAWYIEHSTAAFPMPSFLPLKFHVFAAGMLTGSALLNASLSQGRLLYALAFVVVSFGERSGLLSAFILCCQFVLMLPHLALGSTGRLIARWNTRICSLPPVKFFADISYSLYLVHLLIALPVFGYVFSHPELPSPIGSPGIWAMYSAGVLAVSVAISYVTYRFIELPGIELGKRLGKHRGPAPTAVPTPEPAKVAASPE